MNKKKKIRNKYWNTAKNGQKKIKLKLPGTAEQDSSNRADYMGTALT